MTPRISLMGLLCACGLALVPVGAQPREKARTVSDEVAKEARKSFFKTYRTRDPKIRLAAVDGLTTFRHPIVERCLAKALKDPDDTVRAAAAVRLGLQRTKSAAKRLLSALRWSSNRRRPTALAGILEGFRTMKTCPPLRICEDLFEKAPKEVQKQIILTLRFRRERDTVAWLAKYLEQPQPDNVDSPTNPPASYWKKKVEAWHHWVTDIHTVLYDLTGTDLAEEDEVRRWLQRGGKIRKLEDDDG